MTSHFWITLAVAALWIVGVWTLFRPGMIFQKWGDWMEWAARVLWKRATKGVWREDPGSDGAFICKPLFACPPCMASVHGTLAWFFWGGGSIQWWIPFIVCLCGAMKIITNLFLNED